ncbi:MAG: acetyl-CoA carboxylase biotin carboxylase subunit [Puniceicoccales bacterium]|jgi:acetyl-CoA carboxylase biotin carboxylase subunit|nr:acetyl-CoA carboxylase biotin carboxylase subunit [Puniceicoccales bacterium]
MIEKVLIANRGEVAVRVIRACKELGIKTLAVYSEADVESLHVHLADEAICIGRAPAVDSYLRADRILAAAEIGNADAIHPGYGFLSENAKFAEQCHACNLIFVGPNAEVIRRMGDKTTAKECAVRAGVPVVPGSDGAVTDERAAVALAREIGFPILLKAVAGGGGRGMRLVHSASAFPKEFSLARLEAEKNFANGAIYFEKFIEEPHHIEFQLLADKQGKIIHLGERDCSIQRRYQKLIEEAPSPFLDNELREKMGDAAVRVARECGYESAGTVEFLVDKDRNFYFMEMNTRIQVEHGVSEEVTGIDLVRWQLLIAAGETLPYEQRDIALRGHAIECRINAEDAAKNFAPRPGTVELYYAPGGPGIRIDSHVYGGYRIPAQYDSMIAKVIAHAENREMAIGRMDTALSGYVIRGMPTTIAYQRAIMRDPHFRKGRYTTKFVGEFSARMPSESLEGMGQGSGNLQEDL